MSDTTLFNYLFTAEAVNGNIIRQTPDDKSLLDPTRSSFYDVMKNLPIKKFSLTARATGVKRFFVGDEPVNLFEVDFTDLSLSINGKKYFPPKYPPHGATIKLIYWQHTIAISKSTLAIEQALISKIKRVFYETKPYSKIISGYDIGWEAHKDNKRCGQMLMKIRDRPIE